jgi:hypothetical protein
MSSIRNQTPAIQDEFYREGARLPETEDDYETQKLIFQGWRNDPRFEPYWTLLDGLIARDFATVRKWAELQALLPLDNYDYGALRDQEACDMEDACRRM